MTRMISVAAALFVAWALVGCSQSGQDVGSAPTLPEIPTETEVIDPGTPTAGDPSTNERGNLEAAPGQKITLPDGGTLVIDKIEPIPLPCPTDDEFTQSTPEHGHFIRLDMRVATAPAGAAGVTEQPSISSQNFDYIQTNGVTFNSDLGTFSAFTCLPTEQQFPSGGLGPGQQFTGSLVLDVPDLNGTLIFFPSGGFMPGADVGYEFKLAG